MEMAGAGGSRRDEHFPGTWRGRVAIAVLLLGFAAAVVPGLAAGDGFLRPPGDRLFPWLGPPYSGTTDGECFWVLGEGVSEDADGVPRARIPTFTLYGPVWPSAAGLVRHNAGWAAAAAAIALTPLLFLWWRRAGTSFGRVSGIACGAAASAAVLGLVLIPGEPELRCVQGVWWTVPAGGALMCAAFLVAPAPVRRLED